MTDIVSSPVSDLLQSRNVPFEQIVIPLSPDKKPIRALEEILGEQGYLPGSVVRSILFRTDAKNIFCSPLPDRIKPTGACYANI